MTISIKTKAYYLFLATLVAGLLCACGSSAPETTPLSPDEPSKPPIVSPAPDEPLASPDRVDVIYFHRPQRCKTCICFEERIDYVIKTYFHDEIDSGKLTFKILNLGDKENTSITRKYAAIGSQLFINSIKDDIDHINDIQEIWSWGCTKDADTFDEEVRNVIEQSIEGKA